MIVKMKKVTFLAHHTDFDEFLLHLHELGLVHVEIKRDSLAEDEDFLSKKEEIATLQKVVANLNKLRDTRTAYVKGDAEKGREALDRYRQYEQTTESLNQELQDTEKTLQYMQVWGDCDMSYLEELGKTSYKPAFFTCPARAYQEEWEERYNAFLINQQAGQSYFVTFTSDVNTTCEEIDAEQVFLSDQSMSKLVWKEKHLRIKLEEQQQSLLSMANESVHDLLAYQLALMEVFDFEELEKCSEWTVGEQVRLVQGYYPASKEKELEQMMLNEKLYYELSTIAEEDCPPVKLKNNFFNRLFEPIAELYELPNYKELDLTPFFAPLYLMFFGFCLGDAGYGLVLIILAGLMKRKNKALKGFLTLGQFLGASTVVFGILTGTFFGIDLTKSDFPLLENIKKYMLDTDQLFELALIFGCIQIVFGMALKVVNITISRGFSYALSALGWFLLITGMATCWILGEQKLLSPQMLEYAYIGVGAVSGVMILFLNDPKRNPLINLGSGIWDVYSMATGLLGDLLSYIRLFALGISSAILGFVFNQLALNMAPDIVIVGPLVMILILLIGHGITLFMSALGSFVHPIRLTFVEFYKNAGFEGGGKPYKPFAKK